MGPTVRNGSGGAGLAGARAAKTVLLARSSTRSLLVAEALELLAANEGARALAGGQTLVNVIKARAASPDALVDLNGLEELKGVELAADGTLTIGAMTTYSEPWPPRRRRRGRSSARSAPRSRTSRCGTAARSAATSARTTRPTTCRR